MELLFHFWGKDAGRRFFFGHSIFVESRSINGGAPHFFAARIGGAQQKGKQ